jgi:hypothetical protein
MSDQVPNPATAVDVGLKVLDIATPFSQTRIGVIPLDFVIEGDTLTIGISTDAKETFLPWP